MKKVLVVIVLAILVGTNTALASSGLETFELSQVLTMSWSPSKGTVTNEKIEDRTVKITAVDPWSEVDFESSFATSKRGQADNLIVLTGSTQIQVMLAHSGFVSQYPQLANWIRNNFQGGVPNADNTRMGVFDTTTEQRKMANFRETKMTLQQDSKSKTWETAFVIKVDHKDTKEFSHSADDAVLVAIRSMDRDQLQEFLKRTNNGEKPLLFVTCYWGTNLKLKGWGTYGRYVLVMFPDIS